MLYTEMSVMIIFFGRNETVSWNRRKTRYESFNFFTPCQVLLGVIKCGMSGGEDRCMQDFRGEAWERGTAW